MENAVSLVPELRQVKTTADIDAARGGKLLTWEGYYSLLLSAATSYDISKGHAVKGNRGFRRVNMHDMDVIDSTDDTSMDMSIDMSPTDFLEINTAKRPPLTPTKKTPPRTPAMSPAACLQLLKTQRIEDNVWKLLPLDVKQFLSAIFRIRRDSSQGSPMSINTQQQMDISQIDYDDQDMESEEVTPPPNVTSESDGGSPTVDDQLLAHLTNQQRLPPGDITRMLSQSRAHPTNKSVLQKSKPRTANCADGKYHVNTLTYRRLGN